MFGSIFPIWLLALRLPGSPGGQQALTQEAAARFLPGGATLAGQAAADLDGDGREEVVVIGSTPTGEDDHGAFQLTIQVLMSGGGKWRATEPKWCGQRLHRLEFRDLDGDARPEAIVHHAYWGADHVGNCVTAFRFRNGRLATLAALRTVDGGTQTVDLEGDGRYELKVWTELLRPEQSRAQIFEHVMVAFGAKSGRMEPVLAHIQNHRLGRSTPIPVARAMALVGEDLLLDLAPVPHLPEWRPTPNLVSGEGASCWFPTWSPRGDALLWGAGPKGMTHWALSKELWVWHRGGSAPIRITALPEGFLRHWAWSPDGRSIAFIGYGGDGAPASSVGTFLYDCESKGRRRLSAETPPFDWLGDGTGLFGEFGPKGESGVVDRSGGFRAMPERAAKLFRRDEGVAGKWSVRHNSGVILLWGAGRTQRLVFKPGHSFDPVLSPDGKDLAFSSFKGGTWRIFTVPTNGIR